ncbi:MAG: hypothetical protein Q4E55_04500 [Bacteroidales bacterium]|nr:hypothetical protein [Bacteroidales bacterium]
MKKYLNKISFMSVLSMLVTAVAFIMGNGVAMAVVNPEVGANGGDTDPNAGTPLETATPDSPNKGNLEGWYSAELNPGETYHSRCKFVFGTRCCEDHETCQHCEHHNK